MAGHTSLATAWEGKMQFRSVPWWLWLIPIGVLLIATSRMPYGFYTFTRIVVSVFAAYFAFVAWKGESLSQVWTAIFGLIAILFNPVIPIYLSRATWFYFDVGTALLIAVHLLFVRVGIGQRKSFVDQRRN